MSNIITSDGIRKPLGYIQRYLRIKPKQGTKTIPFFLNKAQIMYYRLKQEGIRQGKLNTLLIKYRQGGFTTFEEALNFHAVATETNQSAMTIANDNSNTIKMFRIAQLFYRCLPQEVKPNRNFENKKEIEFNSLNSIYWIGTAGNPDVGRGGTYNRIHAAEVPRWQANKDYDEMEDIISGLLEANTYGENVFEGTVKGARGWFYRKWIEAKNGQNNFNTIFIPWFFDSDNAVALEKGEDIIATDEEKDFIRMVKEKYNMNIFAEQIKFRRSKQKIYGKLFKQEFPEDDISCFISSGIHFFDLDIIQGLILKCKKPIETRDNGQVLIWKKAEEGHKYIIGADTSEGVEGGDFSFGGIIDVTTGEQVGCIHGLWKPNVFGKKLCALGFEFNTALLAVEANNHGHSVLNTCLNTVHYPNLYYHKSYDADENSEKLGWQTNVKTRQPMLDGLEQAVRENLMPINDTEFLEQARLFDDSGAGKYEAKKGFHDDRIIGWAIAWQVRSNYSSRDIRIAVVSNEEKEEE